MIMLLYTRIAVQQHTRLLSQYAESFGVNMHKKVMAYNRWEDVQLCLLGRVLLLKSLQMLGISAAQMERIGYTAEGKPYFKDNRIQFNIAHSGEVVVCAVDSSSEIGVDVECMKNIPLDEFKEQMLASEWAAIQSAANKLEAFYRYWTQKEAVLKAHGGGLLVPLKSFLVEDSKAVIDHHTYCLVEIELDRNYCCNIASKNKFIKESDVEIKEFFL